MANIDHDPTPSDLPEPMPWDELAHRLQAEKLALREELDTARQHRREAVAALEEARALIETAEQDGYVSAGWREDARRWAACWADVTAGGQ